MSYSPSAARHSTHVERSAQALPTDGGGGTRHDYDPPDDTSNSGEGESRSYSGWFDSSRDSDGAVASRADCGSLVRAYVSGGEVGAVWSAYQVCVVNKHGYTATAHEEGFARSERLFTADSNAAEISGQCWLDTSKFSFADLPNLNDFDISLVASAGSGWNSYISADYIRNTGTWIVRYRYVYTVGTTSFSESGMYNRTGLDGLNRGQDRIAWSHVLPTVGRQLKAESLINKTSWGSGFKANSDHLTHVGVTETRSSGLGCQAVTKVDEAFTQRTFPLSGFPPGS